MAIRTVDLGIAFDDCTDQALATPDSEPPPPPEEAAPMSVAPELLSAVLRWRTRWIRRALAPREAQGLRLIPVLFHVSFPTGDLRGEPPGIEGLEVRRTWGGLARAFDLPPPIARQRGRRLVTAVLATHTPKDGLEIFVVAAPGIGTAEQTRVTARVLAAEATLRSRGLPFKVTPLTLDTLDPLTDPLLGLVPFGALLGGRLPERFWKAPESQAVSLEALAHLVERAPTSFCAQAMLLGLGSTAVPAPTFALQRALEDGQRSWGLADPDFFCAYWSAIANPKGRLLFEALAAAGSDERLRRAASAAIHAPFAPNRPPGEIARLGRSLVLASLDSLRKAPKPLRARLEPWVKRELLARGMPSLLLPALVEGFRALDPSRGSVHLVVKRVGRLFEARDPSGAPLGRGATPDQALLRALTLLADALSETPEVDDPSWRVLADRLKRPLEKRTLLLAIEPADAVGSPHDPLNRGPHRAVGFGDVLAVTLRPGGRPCARRIPAWRAVEQLVAEAAAGTTVMAIAVSGEAHPGAARLMRVANLARSVNPANAPLALEAGGRVLRVESKGVRIYPLKRFAARPRLCTPDPEAPDLSPWAEDKLPQSPLGGNRVVITSFVSRIGTEHAAILYLDSQGYQLHEEVPLLGLEEYLADAQAIVRARPSPMLLFIRTSKEIEAAIGRYALAGNEAKIDVEIRGTLPFGIQVQFLGERFGSGLPLGWDAAAQTVLSAWPSGAQGLFCCKGVTVELWGRPAAGLARLYARSLALRRLRMHVCRACRA